MQKKYIVEIPIVLDDAEAPADVKALKDNQLSFRIRSVLQEILAEGLGDYSEAEDALIDETGWMVKIGIIKVRPK